MSENVKEVSEGSFEQIVLQSEKPVLVDFGRNGADRAASLGR